jgi:hypothetical protein
VKVQEQPRQKQGRRAGANDETIAPGNLDPIQASRAILGQSEDGVFGVAARKAAVSRPRFSAELRAKRASPGALSAAPKS